MIKVSSNQVKTVLAEASTTIRDLVGKNEALTEKLASYRKRERCEKIASEMETKGIYSEVSLREKIANLIEKTDEQLDKIEGAVEFQPQLSKVASLDEKVASSVDPLRKLIEILD